MQKTNLMRVALGISAVLLVFAARAQAQTLTPTVNLLPPVTVLPAPDFTTLPSITFDSTLFPTTIPPTVSTEEQQIITSDELARQQVQAALIYLETHQTQILAGTDQFYNSVFGDFYVPNNPYTGQYDRTIQVPVLASPLTDNNGNVILNDLGQPLLDPSVDRFGNPLTVTTLNTANYQDVVSTFTAIQDALNGALTISPLSTATSTLVDPTNANSPSLFDQYIFNLALNSSGTYVPSDKFVGDSAFGNPAFSVGNNVGFIQWGDSNSESPAHLAQIQNDPNNPLLWALDNASLVVTNAATGQQSVAIDPTTGFLFLDPDTGKPMTLARAEQLSELFDKLKLDAFGQSTATTDANGNPTVSSQLFVGGAFLNGLQIKQNGLTDTTPTSQLVAALPQYQQLIMALAQSAGGTVTGLTNFTGTNNPYFLQAFNSQSYSQFAALTASVTNGVGNGTQLPPPGKVAQFLGNFIPVSNNLTFGNTIVTGL